jgi:hypothetical protein
MECDIVLTDNEYEKIMVSKIWNNGNWPLRFAIKTMFLDQYLSEEDVKESGLYEVSILAVSPVAAGRKNVSEAVGSCGLADYDIKKYPLLNYEALIDYGIFATLWHKAGDNLEELTAEANKELEIISIMFGFYMDRPENMIGNDGWDFIRGQIGFKKKRK